jgi:hypothetical protein
VNYKWQTPMTRAVEPKTVHIIHVGEYRIAVDAFAR